MNALPRRSSRTRAPAATLGARLALAIPPVLAHATVLAAARSARSARLAATLVLKGLAGAWLRLEGTIAARS